MTEAAIALFVLAALIASVRLLLAPNLADRVIALDVTLISFMGAIAANAAHTNSSQYLILLVVIAIIGFTATVSAARFLQHEQIGLGGPVEPGVPLESGDTGPTRGSDSAASEIGGAS